MTGACAEFHTDTSPHEGQDAAVWKDNGYLEQLVYNLIYLGDKTGTGSP